jgi:hypothetical protein
LSAKTDSRPLFRSFPIIDLWAALHHLDLRAAALDLVQTFDLEPAPAR